MGWMSKLGQTPVPEHMHNLLPPSSARSVTARLNAARNDLVKTLSVSLGYENATRWKTFRKTDHGRAIARC